MEFLTKSKFKCTIENSVCESSDSIRLGDKNFPFFFLVVLQYFKNIISIHLESL